MSVRFVRVPAGTVGSIRLAGRADVNPALDRLQATDVDRFGALLRHAFGAPDQDSDADYSYCVRDQHTGLVVRAYAAQSGPAYGGMPDECCVAPRMNRYDLKPQAAQVLGELDAWLEQHP
jgi:hypothetical protein